MRIERFVETNNLLSYEQAGFRKREECVGQVVSLDIIQRRQNAGLNTHVYSSISERHSIQSPLVHCYGSCRTWDSLVVLLPFSRHCTHPHLLELGQDHFYRTIPSTERCQTGMSIVWTAVQSVHQRHSRWCRTHHSPWTTARHQPHPRTHVRRRCWQFADSEQSLLAASTAIEQWAKSVGMQFGVAKCGIISFTGHLAPRLDNPLDIRLHGQLTTQHGLSRNGLHSSTPFGSSPSVGEPPANGELPISHILCSGHGKAYYGLELVGGNKSHLAPLRQSTRVSDCSLGPTLDCHGPLLVETGIGSLLTRPLYHGYVCWSGRDQENTHQCHLLGTDNDVFTLNVQGQLVRSQRWFWSRRTKQLYRNRYWLTPQVRPKTVKQRHSFALMETLRTCGDSASLQKYVTRQLLDTSGFFKDPSFDQSRAHGTRYLMLARMDALWTARKAIQIGI
ncbi:hypothetical protein BASA83_009232 [Batrachochytrium salamandrivorans]|nr:hypothetical protein BASA83_009232 [Batrachochytrium salamandrivorans]